MQRETRYEEVEWRNLSAFQITVEKEVGKEKKKKTDRIREKVQNGRSTAEK